jgi:4-amino-4-deoxy-L-arabinose transferase-like glycosyltransferase
MQISTKFLRSQKTLLIIIAIAVILRLGVAFLLGNDFEIRYGTADQRSYHALAQRVANGYGFTFEYNWWPVTKAGEPTAHWSFLYTLFLAVIYKLFGPNPIVARVIQAIIVGILHPSLAYLIGKYIFNKTIGLLAAGLTAVYAYFIYYSATLMTEPFYITAILASFTFSILIVNREVTNNQSLFNRRSAILSLSLGLSIAVAVLLRQLYLLFIPFLFFYLWITTRKQGGKSTLPSIILATCIILVLIIPFTIYNYIRFDRFVLLNTNAGYALYWANHPVYGNKFIPILPEEIPYRELIPSEILHLDEAALDQELLRRGIKFILDDPIRYISLSITRIPVYITFWPLQESDPISNISRILSFGVLIPFMLFGLYRSISEKTLFNYSIASPTTLLLLFIIVYSGIHILTWALIRYRLPVDAVLLIFAGLALYEIGNRYLSWRHNSRQAI